MSFLEVEIMHALGSCVSSKEGVENTFEIDIFVSIRPAKTICSMTEL